MKIPEIKVTKDYSIFKRLEGNRDIKCVKKIINSINKVGYLFVPVMCNEKMEVIDGQNRIEACRELDLPVYYYCIKGIGKDEAISLNLGRTNWKPIDYVKSYAEEGKKDYQYLLKLLIDFPYFNLQEITGVLINKPIISGWTTNILNEGDFSTTEAEYRRARKKLELLNDITETLDKMIGARRLTITAIAWCLDVKGVDEKRLISKIMYEYPKIRPIVDIDIFLEDMENIYNSNLKDKKNKVFFHQAYKER